MAPSYIRWMHYVRHKVFTDLESHIPADAGREAIMEAGPDASIRNFIGKGGHVGKAMGHAECSGARYRNLRNFVDSECGRNDARNGVADNANTAMSASIGVGYQTLIGGMDRMSRGSIEWFEAT